MSDAGLRLPRRPFPQATYHSSRKLRPLQDARFCLPESLAWHNRSSVAGVVAAVAAVATSPRACRLRAGEAGCSVGAGAPSSHAPSSKAAPSTCTAHRGTPAWAVRQYKVCQRYSSMKCVRGDVRNEGKSVGLRKGERVKGSERNVQERVAQNPHWIISFVHTPCPSLRPHLPQAHNGGAGTVQQQQPAERIHSRQKRPPGSRL